MLVIFSLDHGVQKLRLNWDELDCLLIVFKDWGLFSLSMAIDKCEKVVFGVYPGLVFLERSQSRKTTITVLSTSIQRRAQRKNTIKSSAVMSSFSVSFFNVREDRRLGSGSFGDVFAGSFVYSNKSQCVKKKTKQLTYQELILEGRVLKTIFDEPPD